MPGMCRADPLAAALALTTACPWAFRTSGSRLLKDVPDDKWDMFSMWYELTTRRPQGEERRATARSHDQALVGDKTLIFRMADAEMYTGMDKDVPLADH